MEQVPVKLFGTRTSFYVHRVQVALHLKGIEYEFVEEDLENKSELLLLYNPIHKKVPVLLHEGHSIVESTIIIEYIDEVWKGSPILPADAHDRAVVRFWCHFAENKLRASFRAMIRSSDEGKAAASSDFRENLMLLEGELRDGRRYFGGEKIGMLDIVVGCGFHSITAYEELTGVKVVDSESFPLFTDWYENFKGCQEIKEVLPPTTELIEYVKFTYHQRVAKTNGDATAV